MGTNYYVAKNLCDCCKRYDEEYHIGKSSYGWAFSFQGYKYDGLVSWKHYKEFLRDKIIMDEYGDRIDYADFVNLIETVKSPSFVNPNGNKNQLHNDAARKAGYFNPEYDWDDEDGYSFCAREFS